MGGSLQIEEQLKNYKEKKRQNHPIFGEIVTIQSMSESKLYTIKSINMENLICERQFQKLRYLNKNEHNNYYISIKKLNIDKNVLTFCSSEKKNYIVFDCVEIDLQRIQQSEYFTKFKQNEIINIIWCVLEGLITLQNKKLSVFPICKKSVILQSFSDEYRGQDLSQAIFKVIPINLIKQQAIKITTSPFLFPPQIQNSVASLVKSTLMLQFTPKNHIYCLGMMILDMIYHHTKQEQISFGDQTNKSKIYNKQTEIQTLENCGISLQLVQMIKLMIQENQQKRIGLTSLYDSCKILLQKNTAKLTMRSQNFNKILQKQSILTSKLSSRFSRAKLSKKQQISESSQQIHSKKQYNGLIHHIKKQRISSGNALSDMTNIPSFTNNMKDIPFIKCIQFKDNQQCHANVRSRKLPKRLYFDNGAFYQGQLNKYGQFHGFGTLYYTQSQICYTGYWYRNNFHGFGYLFSNYFVDNKQNQITELPSVNYLDFSQGSEDYGPILWKHYQGEFKNDRKDGFGVLFFIDGSKFEGQFLSNRCHGAGTYVRADGIRINGYWRNNKMIKQYGCYSQL